MVSLAPLALMVLGGACTAPQTPSPDLVPDGIGPDRIEPDRIGHDEIDWFFDRLIIESQRCAPGQISDHIPGQTPGQTPGQIPDQFPDQIPGHMQANPMFGMMRDLQDDAAQAQELQRLLDRLGARPPLGR